MNGGEHLVVERGGAADQEGLDRVGIGQSVGWRKDASAAGALGFLAASVRAVEAAAARRLLNGDATDVAAIDRDVHAVML